MAQEKTYKPLLIPLERIEHTILFIRGYKVMLDKDLAELYGVSTKVLIQAVKRNIERFPAHFMFQLSLEEAKTLRSQIVTSNNSVKRVQGRGGRRFLSYAFTEQGVAMLSSVLHSKRAILVNIAIMDAFVKLRQLLSTHSDLARKLDNLEKKYDYQFKAVFDAIRQLMQNEKSPRRKIGFKTSK